MLLVIILSYNPLQQNRQKLTPGPPRTHRAPGLASALPAGGGAISEGRRNAGCSDDDPQNASAALGWRSKQVGFPRGEKSTRAANGPNVAA